MTPTEGVKLTLKGQEYSLRLTVPRLCTLNQQTGKGTRQLLIEAIGLNIDAMVWLLWAAITHPGQANKAIVAMTRDQVMGLLDLQDTGSIIDALAEVVGQSFKKPDSDQDPQPPTTQT